MASEQKTCGRCKVSFPVEYEAENQFAAMLARLSVFCPVCLPVLEAEGREHRKQEEATERKARWSKICPLEYQNTNLEHPGLSSAFLAAARGWEINSRKGLGFTSESGMGKTRLLYWCLWRAFDAGLWTHATSHTKFRKLAIAATSGDGEDRSSARSSLNMMQRVDVLLFDDLGKAPSTEAVDSEFEDLVESRTSNGRPILWSSNGGGKWLIARFGEDRGKPIVRRLAEFTTIVTQ